uniref:Uncharacterized protein n=1 Tax=Rhizophora mucronata TaxID=61149 RepID=A0A2P2PUB9_RHIMU
MLDIKIVHLVTSYLSFWIRCSIVF